MHGHALSDAELDIVQERKVLPRPASYNRLFECHFEHQVYAACAARTTALQHRWNGYFEGEVALRHTWHAYSECLVAPHHACQSFHMQSGSCVVNASVFERQVACAARALAQQRRWNGYFECQVASQHAWHRYFEWQAAPEHAQHGYFEGQAAPCTARPEQRAIRRTPSGSCAVNTGVL